MVALFKRELESFFQISCGRFLKVRLHLLLAKQTNLIGPRKQSF